MAGVSLPGVPFSQAPERREKHLLQWMHNRKGISMQRGKYVHLGALAAALSLVAGAASAGTTPTTASPLGIFTADVGLSDGAHKGSGSTTVSGTGTAAVYTVNATGFDITGNKDRGYLVYTTLPGDV